MDMDISMGMGKDQDTGIVHESIGIEAFTIMGSNWLGRH